MVLIPQTQSYAASSVFGPQSPRPSTLQSELSVPARETHNAHLGRATKQRNMVSTTISLYLVKPRA